MLFFSDLHQFRLVSDESLLRDSSVYQQIRSEINRRNVPLAGGTDWDNVRKLCEQIGASEGVDLLVAVYYTVAAIKTQGLSGLAVGLELQAAVIKKFGANSAFPAIRRSELLTWMVGKIGPEIRSLNPSVKQLRDLYRCERACHSLHNQFSLLQPDQVPDLDMIAFTIFEYIDKLETNAEIAQPKTIEVAAKLSWKQKILPYFGGASLAFIATFGFVYLKQNLDTPNSVVSVEQTIPKVMQPELINNLPLIIDFGDFATKKEEISAFYLDRSLALMDKKVTEDLRQALGLEATLQGLYPGDESLQGDVETLESWKADMLAVVDTQYQRFSRARTNAANINLMVESDRYDQAKVLAKKMEDYAISLSPVYGRAMYIEELIEQGKLESSQLELDKLLYNLKALNLKIALLENKVEGKRNH
ncbi:MAG: type VI secretion system ImpA family N-terminal domain-containing protein [Marinomonas sp.]